MEEELVAYLLADPGVSALVGSRIYWMDRPQGDALPSVTLQVISESIDYTMKGPTALIPYLVQADVWGRTYGSAKAIKRAIFTALHALRWSGSFQGVFLESRDMNPTQGDGPDPAWFVKIYRELIEARVQYRPAS